VIFEHPWYVQILKYDECKSINQLSTFLVREVSALVRNTLMNAGYYLVSLDLVQELMQGHNQRYAHISLRLFIFVQKTALRFFYNYFVCSLVHHLQTQLSRPA